MRVAVAASKFVPGVGDPNDPRGSSDWRTPGNARGVRASFEVLDIRAALEMRFRTDAHLVTYLVCRDGVPLSKQPRVTKPGLDWLLSQCFTVSHDLLMVDVDNPLHAPWTPSMSARLTEALGTVPVLSTCGIYTTTHGYRLIQPLDEPVSAPDSERYLNSWIEELNDHGIHADRSCRDWTRLFRLPYVRRGGGYTSPWLVDLDRMQPRVIHPKAWPGPCGRWHASGGEAA